MNAQAVIENLKQRFPNEPEYIQAVSQVLPTIEEEYNKHPEFDKANLIERLCIPDRVIEFRVSWVDDKGNVQTNMGYRIQHNNVIGPYKGGIRFHKSVNLGILKFLAFEQTFKNSLTTLPMGGAKGGSDFSPRGKSDAEVMRFCQAFMTELYRHVGADEDVPAGDIGVGGREVGYMFGMYKKLTHQFTGMLTGKGLSFGGSLIRPEATGYGNVYFLLNMLKTRNIDIKGKKVLVSGAGNVAQYTMEKLIQLGAIPMTCSDCMLRVRSLGLRRVVKLHFLLLLRMRLTRRQLRLLLQMALSLFLRVLTCLQLLKQSRYSRMQRFCTLQVRQLMLVVYLYQVLRCHRTLSVCLGHQRRLITTCTRL